MNDEIIKIENKIQGVIVSRNMLPQGCTVVVGLSGGADSMALTHFLLKYGISRHIHIIAAHINHGIRGGEADRDERFVTDWSRENGLELKVLHANVPALAAERSQGLEECGRAVRYSFFQSLCDENTKIATAHTLSDSVETVLLNLTKGSGARGLRGIPPIRQNIIRPLIEITRSEVEAYCQYYGICYVTDSTNLTDDYTRNKIRRMVVPVLKEINPVLETAVCGLAHRLGEDEEYLSGLAQEQLVAAQYHGGYQLSMLNSMPDPVLSRAIAQAIGSVSGARLESIHIHTVKALIRAGSGSATVAGSVQCSVQGNTVFIHKQNKTEPWCVPLQPEATPLPDGRTLFLIKLTKKEYENRRKFNNLFFNNVINYATILNIASVRNRREGDVFRPAGRGVTKTLKKLFNEAKIEPLLRDKPVIIETGGKIAWLEGFGASQECCVTDDTQYIAEIQIN